VEQSTEVRRGFATGGRQAPCVCSVSAQRRGVISERVVFLSAGALLEKSNGRDRASENRSRVRSCDVYPDCRYRVALLHSLGRLTGRGPEGHIFSRGTWKARHTASARNEAATGARVSGGDLVPNVQVAVQLQRHSGLRLARFTRTPQFQGSQGKPHHLAPHRSSVKDIEDGEHRRPRLTTTQICGKKCIAVISRATTEVNFPLFSGLRPCPSLFQSSCHRSHPLHRFKRNNATVHCQWSAVQAR